MITAAALYLQIRGSNKTVRLIQDADSRIAQAAQVAKLIVDQESGLRGYEATRDDRFLADFNHAENSIESELDNLVFTRPIATPPSVTVSKIFATSTRTGMTPSPCRSSPRSRAGGHANDVNLNLYGKSSHGSGPRGHPVMSPEVPRPAVPHASPAGIARSST